MNKFRSVRGPQQTQPVPKHRIPITDLSLGAMLDRSPRRLPPGASPELGNVRFEGGALRKDFGSTAIGAAAPTRILGIGEHKFILNEQSYHRLVRLYLEGSVLALDIWDGAGWTRVDTFSDGVYANYLSLASTQSRFLIADGSKILTWYEAALTQAIDEDFPAGNSLTEPGEETEVVLTSQANDDSYAIRYSVDLQILDGSGYTVTIGFYENDVQFTTKEFALASGTQTWVDELITLISTMEAGDTIGIKVEDVAATNHVSKSINWTVGTEGYDLEATKASDTPAYDDYYTFHFMYVHVGPTATTTVGYYVKKGGAWELLGTQDFGAAADGMTMNSLFYIPDMVAGTRFALGIVSGSGSITDVIPGVTWLALEPGIDYNLDVHGYNQAVDGDTYPGVAYTENVPPSSTLELLSASAPAARYILPFGDRLLAYRNNGELAEASWSSDGDITDWVVGGAGDAGSTVLIDTRSDGIDAIMGAAVLSSSIVAVFRQRSIMRAQETGNISLAVGHFHWIENLGTESPFSLQSTPYGVMFLGHDLQVYMLTEQGPQAVGMPIHRDLVEKLTSNLHLVDSAYDPVFAEYWLGIPEDNAGNITGVWILDIRRLVEQKALVWRYRSMNVERFGNASVIE